MKRPWAVAVLTVAVTVASVTGLGYVHPFGNPRVEPAKGLGTLLQGANMPADAKAVLVAKCADCHSSETRWPVYARVAPGSWLMERDIVEARKHMDLSRWEQMPIENQEVLLAKISHEAKSGEMPPLQYLVLHWGANLSQADVHTLSMLGKNAGGSEATLSWGWRCCARQGGIWETLHGLPCAGHGPGGAEAGRSVWPKGWECAGV